jgi:hypothetical protein
LLEASALFILNSQSAVGANLQSRAQMVSTTGEEAKMNVGLDEGRSEAGQLQWGMQMARLCVAPQGARFQRTFPRNNFERIVNFIKFNILEPILPAST